MQRGVFIHHGTKRNQPITTLSGKKLTSPAPVFLPDPFYGVCSPTQRVNGAGGTPWGGWASQVFDVLR